jgi:hypothetical protein
MYSTLRLIAPARAPAEARSAVVFGEAAAL